VVHGRQRHRDHIEIGGRVLFQTRHGHQGIAEQLVEPGPHLLGDGQCLASLDPGDDFQQIRALDLVDRALAQQRKNVLVEDAWEYRGGALPALLETEFAMGEPLPVHSFEGVLTGELGNRTLLLAVNTGIDALGDQGPCFVAKRTGFE